MFGVKTKKAEMEHSKNNDFVNFIKVDQTFQGDFPTVAQSRIQLSPDANLYVQCLGRPTQDVWSQNMKGRSGTEQVERL